MIPTDPTTLGRLAARQGLPHLMSRCRTLDECEAFQAAFDDEQREIKARRAAWWWGVQSDGNAEHRLTKGELL